MNEIIKKRLNEKFEFVYLQEIVDKTAARSGYANQVKAINELQKINTKISRSEAYRSIYDSVYNSIYDSTASSYRAEERRKILNRQIPEEIIKSAATAGVKEAIPILEEALRTKNPQFDKDAVELTLARFGDKKLQEKLATIYSSNFDFKDDDFKKKMITRLKALSYISTQESVYNMHAFMDTTRWDAYLSNGSFAPSGRYAIMMLLETVVNKDIQEKFAGMNLDYLDDPNLVIYAREWLLKNKGKYQINHLHFYYHFR